SRRSIEQTSNLWLARALWDLGAVQFGDFTLGRTTLHSPVYVNPRLLISKPNALRRAARVILEEVRTLQAMRHPHVAPFDLVAGIPFGGLHLATPFSLLARVPLIYIHPAKERDGRRQFIEGRYQRGQRVLIIDDLITTGGNVLETVITLGMAGLVVRDVVVLIDRQEGARERLRQHGYNLVSILGLEVMLNHLMSRGKIDENWYRQSIDYIHSRRPENVD
ncbi:MAG: orotate phosphoribosyltransferase, partial [Dehalococcoidia bacterium]